MNRNSNPENSNHKANIDLIKFKESVCLLFLHRFIIQANITLNHFYLQHFVNANLIAHFIEMVVMSL